METKESLHKRALKNPQCTSRKYLLYPTLFSRDPRPHWYWSIAWPCAGAAPTIEGAVPPTSGELDSIAEGSLTPKGEQDSSKHDTDRLASLDLSKKVARDVARCRASHVNINDKLSLENDMARKQNVTNKDCEATCYAMLKSIIVCCTVTRTSTQTVLIQVFKRGCFVI